jgi:hypothetical protein
VELCKFNARNFEAGSGTDCETTVHLPMEECVCKWVERLKFQFLSYELDILIDTGTGQVTVHFPR